MKRIYHAVLLPLLVLMSLGTVRAQEINGEFEQWRNEGGIDVPVGWSPSPFGVGKGEGARNGRFSASVWNWYHYGKGILMLGESGRMLSQYDLDKSGIPIPFKPARLTGHYRYKVGSVREGERDSAMILVLLKKFNPVTRTPDTVGYAVRYLHPSDEFIPFSVDIIDAAPGVQPDSVAVGFFSSVSGMCYPPTECYYLSIDDVRLSAASGVSYGIADRSGTARACPNPVSGAVRIAWDEDLRRPHQLRIYSLSGELVGRRDGVTGNSATFDCAGLPPGQYLFDLLGDAGAVAARGRFLME